MELSNPPSWLFTSTLCALALSACVNVWLLSERKALVGQTSQQHLTSTLSLPDGWWSDPGRFQNERRAIFSQTWMCVSHRGRFQNVGDYIVYEAAGFRFFMILGKDHVVRSFHNVCRHRAFPVARKQSGSATVLGCRYHGWSYDTKGALIKAPFFDKIPGFDKSQNSLYEILTKQDSNGFLHINVSTLKDAASSRPAEPAKVGKVSKISADCALLDTLEFKGRFNWKIMLNNQAGASSTGISAKGVVRSFSTQGPTPVGELDFYPLTTVHTMTGRPFWYQITYSPDTAQQTSLRCDVYSATRSGSFKFEGAVKETLEQELKEKIHSYEEEHEMLVSAGRNVIPANDAQATVAVAVERHLREEMIRGSEIKPAAVTQQFRSGALTKAEQICKATECGNGGSEKLAW